MHRLVKKIIVLFKLIVVPMLFVFLMLNLHKITLLNTLNMPSFKQILSIIICVHIYFLLFAFRFYYVLRKFGAEIKYWRMFIISQQALFYLYTIPSTLGYETTRFGKVFSHAKNISKYDATQAVLLDRSLGLFASIIILLAVMPFIHLQSIPHFNLTMPLVALLFIIAVIIIALLIPAPRKFLFNLLHIIIIKRKYIMRALGISIVVQFALIACLLLICQAFLGHFIAFNDMSFMQSISNLGAIIPISFAGVSGNEAGQALASIALGYTMSTAIFLTIAIYACKFIGAIEGGLVEWLEGVFAITLDKSGENLHSYES